MSRLHIHPEAHLVSRIGWRPAAVLDAGISAASLVFLAILGGYGARAGGANVGKAILRVIFWGGWPWR